MRRLSRIALSLLSLNVIAQVCCSPVGSGQAGGGAIMNNSVAQWPNQIFYDTQLHWTTDIQVSILSPSGNIEYGPQLNASLELSKSLNPRNVFYVSGSYNLGSLHERVTYQQFETLTHSGKARGGIRHSLGKAGRNWLQMQFSVPGPIKYQEDSFPFDSEESAKIEILLLRNQIMPWSIQNPGFLGLLSITGLFQKNLEQKDNILSDQLSLLHLSSTVDSWYPFYVAPYAQIRSEQLLAPPSIWTAEREVRSLSSIVLGVDLAINRPVWDAFKLRIGIPVFAHSSSNGFPDGTQPASYLKLAVNWGGSFSENSL
ncbi:hypothetical protein HQ531_01005 [bacterium]|nr:hypothetical protein [bacterium]